MLIFGRINCFLCLCGQITAHYSVLVTTYGLEKNEYSSKFQKVLTMDDLFRF